MEDEILDTDAVAKLLHCDPETVEIKARKGDFPGLKIGKGWIFPRAALMTRLVELALEEAALRREPKITTPEFIAQSALRGRMPPLIPKFPG